MALEAQYTAQMQWVDTPEMKARVEAIAASEKVSKASVVRDIMTAGIHAREQRSPLTRLEGDRRPHSRACGIQPHDHGERCSKDCPTCSEQPAEPVVGPSHRRTS